MSERPRVLLAITAYNGRDIVPRAVRSAKRLNNELADVDIVVLDDCSPERGFSAMISQLCRELDVLYYRSPRNLGIPRNVSLAMLMAEQLRYDYVVISNSDVLYAACAIDELVRVHLADPSVGSVTAWSNNVSVFSLPNGDPDSFLANQDVVDWLGASLAGKYAANGMDIPAGISFAMLVPTDVIRDVGIMDPVFGRGYCEEIDWSLRSRAAGYRVALGLGAFVYHQGRGSNLEAGVIAGDQTSVPENEAIIDMRYPLFRTQVSSFIGSGLLARAQDDAVERIILDGARQYGYSLEVGWLPSNSANSAGVHCVVAPEGNRPSFASYFLGFVHERTLESDDPGAEVRGFFGSDPTSVNVYDRGRVAGSLVDAAIAAGSNVRRFTGYPTRV